MGRGRSCARVPRPPPVGGLGRCRGHLRGDKAAAAGHSAPSPPVRTTSGPRRSDLPRPESREGPRLPSAWARGCRFPGEPWSPGRVSGVSERLASRRTRLLETHTSTPPCSKCSGHCGYKKQKCDRALKKKKNAPRAHSKSGSANGPCNCCKCSRCPGSPSICL